MKRKYYYLIIFIFIECILILTSKYVTDILYYDIIFIIYLIIFPICFYLISKKEFSTLAYITLFYFIFKTSPFVFDTDKTVLMSIFKWKRIISITYLLYLITRIFIAVRLIRKRNYKTNDDFTKILLILINYFRIEKIARLIGFEAGAIYYCFFKWKRKPSENIEYTCYKTNGSSYQLYGVILFISIIEAYAFQIFLHEKHPIIATILLFFHIYFFITIIGHLKATYFRRNLLLEDAFIIHYGLFETVEIPFNNIQYIKKDNGNYDKTDKSTIKYGLLGQLEMHNTLITLKTPIKVYLPFGKSKTPNRVLFFVDEVDSLIEKIESKI